MLTHTIHVRSLLFAMLPSSLLVASLLASGCAPSGAGEDTDEVVEYSWNESEDSGNEFPQNPEEVNEAWEGRLTITGQSQLCDWDEDEDWPWTGDNDNFAVTVPHDGYLEAILSWDTSTDYYLMIYLDVPEGPAAYDELVDNTAENGPETYLFEEESDEGDEVVFGIACDGGEEGEYTLEILWED